MPVEIPPSAICEMVVMARLFGQRIMLVRHYRRDDGETDTLPDGQITLTDFIDSYDNNVDGITTELNTYCTTELVIESVRGQWIYPVRFAYITRTPIHTAGSKAPPTMPQNLAGVITLQTDTGGRHGRGNAFIAGLEELATNQGYITGLAKTHLGVIAATLMNSLSDVGATHTVHPIVFRKALPSASQPITHYKVQDEVRTMRRRTVGRGA